MSREMPFISTPSVRFLVQIYDAYYRDSRRCICDRVKYPDSAIENEALVVCTAHRWLDMRARAFKDLVEAGLSRPMPNERVFQGLNAQFQATLQAVEEIYPEEHSGLDGNPLDLGPFFIEPKVPKPAPLGITYAGILSANNGNDGTYGRQHAPVLISTKMITEIQFKHQPELTQAVEDILGYAPVVVLVDSDDSRISLDPFFETIYTRQYGVMVNLWKDKGRGG